jgi:hypothetical protein
VGVNVGVLVGVGVGVGGKKNLLVPHDWFHKIIGDVLFGTITFIPFSDVNISYDTFIANVAVS